MRLASRLYIDLSTLAPVALIYDGAILKFIAAHMWLLATPRPKRNLRF